jgi:flagellar biogenesis protein FliO
MNSLVIAIAVILLVFFAMWTVGRFIEGSWFPYRGENSD